MALDIMLVVGYLGTAIVMIFLGRNIDDKQKTDNGNLVNPFLTGCKVLLYAGAFWMIILNFFSMRMLVKYENNLSNFTLRENLTQMIGQCFVSTTWIGVIAFTLLIISLIAMVLIQAKEVAKFKKQKGDGF